MLCAAVFCMKYLILNNAILFMIEISQKYLFIFLIHNHKYVLGRSEKSTLMRKGFKSILVLILYQSTERCYNEICSPAVRLSLKLSLFSIHF